MRRTTLPARFQKLLQRIPYATLATADENGRPWGTPIVGHFDEGLNFYFITAYESQHGRNIRNNPRIFVTLFDSTARMEQAEGLYFQMRTRIITKPAAIRSAMLTAGLHFTEPLPRHQALIGDCPRRLYKAAAEHIWYNDVRVQDGHELDIRLELMS